MPNPFEALVGLDKLIHEPARLAILTALSVAVKADFVFLEGLTGLTKGNLSTHLSKLEEGGLIVITKQFADKRPITYVSLSDKGRAAIHSYWQEMQRLREQSAQWQPQQSED